MRYEECMQAYILSVILLKTHSLLRIQLKNAHGNITNFHDFSKTWISFPQA